MAKAKKTGKPQQQKKPKKSKGTYVDSAGAYCQEVIMVTEELYNEKLAVINHRLDKLEQEQKEANSDNANEHKEMKKEIRENADLKFAIQSLSDVVADLKVTVNELNSKDGKAWNKAKWIIISNIIAFFLAFVLGSMWS